MEHAHDVSKAAEKSGAPPIRKPVVPEVSSGAGGILNLQRAAGNQAVAKLLKSPASGLNAGAVGLESPATEGAPPITIQGAWLDEAFDTYYHGADRPDPTEFVAKLVAKVNEPVRLPGAETEGAPKPTTGTPAKSGAGTTTAVKAATPLPTLKIPDKGELNRIEQNLDEQEKVLTGTGLTDEEKDLLARSKKLELRQQRIKAEQDLKEREKKLGYTPTQEERDLKERTEALEAKEQQKKTAEELAERRKKLEHKASPEEIKLEQEKANLDLLERRQKFEKKLTPEEIKVRAANEELDVLEEEKKGTEEREALARKRAIMAKRLNPNKKSLSELKGGRKF